MPGILIINKPSGMTSHDVVDAVRRITGEQRVGHAGTLDPFATGVLVVGVGREATKALGSITTGTMKKYRATVRLGATSETGDPEGPVTEREDVTPPKRSDIQKALQSFTGTIQQTPPAYSSIKVGGVKSYDRARRGETVQLEPREVTIHELSIVRYAWPELVIDVVCSSGTYIRVLAADIGEKLGVGGYCAALERTAVGTYTIQMARTLKELEQNWQKAMLPVPRTPPSLHL
ncbi:MAG: tRNA pseudouridine(55) synthase TruB [Candidatus Kerfeldbacteria bacterium]|nr:tRNA pseudouridine(55) synthase TruB [Candidatus Kerfeldbacteria bacterium]